MPEVTKRVLTDETGQDIVEALQDLVNVVDPNGTTVAAAAKLNNMTVAVNQLASGSTPTSSLTTVDNHFHLELGIPVDATIMVGATSEENGIAGLAPTPTPADVDKFLAGDGTYKSGGLPMVILSYGHSTWQDFINAYNNNVIVYCRASSNANPGTGSLTRMGFMAYVNNAEHPTEVEFQYYRSTNPTARTVNSFNDQVYVYKLESKNGGTWSVTAREAGLKSLALAAGNAGSVAYDKNTGIVTLNTNLPAVTAADDGKILTVVNGVWTAVAPT